MVARKLKDNTARVTSVVVASNVPILAFQIQPTYQVGELDYKCSARCGFKISNGQEQKRDT